MQRGGWSQGSEHVRGVRCTACTACSPGTASFANGLTIPCGGCDGTHFAASAGLTACALCDTSECGIGYGASQCTTIANSVCVACSAITRCTYITAGQCVRFGAYPACVCDPGYEMLSGACQLCTAGKFKASADYSACAPWTVSLCSQQGTYFVQGSPYDTSACLACPELPANSVQTTGGCLRGGIRQQPTCVM
jgi:hypothetical protein